MHHEGDASLVSTVAERIRRLQKSLPSHVRLVAVSKGVPAEAIRTALVTGITDIGENRVQEGLSKQEQLGDVGVSWHLIGKLQSNKIRRAVAHFDWIHSVESLAQAEAISQAAEAMGKRQNVLVQVNVAGEASKGGFAPDDAWAALPRLGQLNGLAVRGLMTIAPKADDPKTVRPVFRSLRELLEKANAQGWNGIALTELSMGMSADYQVALAEGATIIRLGTALFGPRRDAPGPGAAQ